MASNFRPPPFDILEALKDEKLNQDLLSEIQQYETLKRDVDISNEITIEDNIISNSIQGHFLILQNDTNEKEKTDIFPLKKQSVSGLTTSTTQIPLVPQEETVSKLEINSFPKKGPISIRQEQSFKPKEHLINDYESDPTEDYEDYHSFIGFKLLKGEKNSKTSMSDTLTEDYPDL